MKIIKSSLLFALLLTGCSSYNNDFDCPLSSDLATQSSDSHLDRGWWFYSEKPVVKIVPQKESDDKVFKGVSDCSQKQNGSSLLRSKDLCVHIGTYCAEKDPITQVCLKKKSRYCCFKSKLARLIQEQGRKQLGLSFGRHDHPNCRGLTVEELNQIDFEQIDLASLFSELSQHSQSSDHRKTDLRLHPLKTKGVAS